MADRDALIAQKEDIRRQIERVQRQLTQARAIEGDRRHQRRVAALEARLEQLTAQEYALRLAIDRCAPA